MPKYLHDKIEKSAIKKGLKGKAKQRYIYATLAKIEAKRKKKHK